MNFYTYGHYTDSGTLFYVGKGVGKRAYSKTNRNIHWQRKVKKCGLKVEIFAKWETEKEAHDHERLLIACFRDDLGFKLCNMTDGGEGSSGWKPPQEFKDKVSTSSKELWKTPEFRAKMAARPPGGFTDKKRITTLTNAQLARDALKDPIIKAQASEKNSKRAKIMWSDDAFRKSMSEKHMSLWTDKRKAELAQRTLGRIRMTNGIEERNVLPADVEGLQVQGWKRGRKAKGLPKRTHIN